MSSDLTANNNDDSSRLSIMAVAIERMRSADAGADAPPDHRGSGGAIMPSPTRRSKLILPNLTPAIQQDLVMSKGSAGKAPKPLSIMVRPEFANYQLEGIVTPHPHDVLCGRGGGSNNHPGNESFRELVNEVKFPYVNCPKREKPLLARRIVEAVRNQTPPGRFLCKDSKMGLWNDIGDGKAREKTSQALREGAPIIRDLIGKPTSPTNVAAVVNLRRREAKKAERDEKECSVTLPRGAPQEKDEDWGLVAAGVAEGVHHVVSRASPSLACGEPALQRGKSVVISPRDAVMNTDTSVPPLKKFRAFADQNMPVAAITNGQMPAAWPTLHQPGRNFYMMPYGAHHAPPTMGGYASKRRGPMDYSNGRMPPSRYPPVDSVPLETVRQLLLGQLDPVQLALRLLLPEEARIVARRHVAIGLQHMGDSRGVSGHGLASHRLPMAPVVSDGSSSSLWSGECTSQRTSMRNASDQIAGAAQVGGDDGSSVDSSNLSSKQPNNGTQGALPKKKRKYSHEEP